MTRGFVMMAAALVLVAGCQGQESGGFQTEFSNPGCDVRDDSASCVAGWVGPASPGYSPDVEFRADMVQPVLVSFPDNHQVSFTAIDFEDPAGRRGSLIVHLAASSIERGIYPIGSDPGRSIASVSYVLAAPDGELDTETDTSDVVYGAGVDPRDGTSTFGSGEIHIDGFGIGPEGVFAVVIGKVQATLEDPDGKELAVNVAFNVRKGDEYENYGGP